jgi:hypothetical protein
LRHRLLDLMDGQTVLSGAIPGRRLLSALIAATPSPETPVPAFLDFSGVEVATASFLRESVISFRDYARLSLPNIYPVVANLAAAVPRSSTSSSARGATCFGVATSIPRIRSSWRA